MVWAGDSYGISSHCQAEINLPRSSIYLFSAGTEVVSKVATSRTHGKTRTFLL